ncbi:hypothetical protein [Butyrivibrio sp. YAB3001]|nr:hypothetical protein [Butyrivibrio sp. YAB3001]
MNNVQNYDGAIGVALGHSKFCKHFCVTCEYYDICHRDGELG